MAINTCLNNVIKYLRIIKSFDASRMQADISRLNDFWWKEHYNKMNFTGGWHVLPLRSINGNSENIVSIHSSDKFHKHHYDDTIFLNDCPYLKSVIDYFECEKTSIRLMKLEAGAIIKEHRDHEMSFEEGEIRFHIPVITNALVKFVLDDERVIMHEGECWYLNLSLKHQVINEGEIDRVHLVIDCKVNDWIKKLFSENVSIQKNIDAEEKKDYSKEDTLKIIAQLRIINTPTSLKLASKMEKEL